MVVIEAMSFLAVGYFNGEAIVLPAQYSGTIYIQALMPFCIEPEGSKYIYQQYCSDEWKLLYGNGSRSMDV